MFYPEEHRNHESLTSQLGDELPLPQEEEIAIEKPGWVGHLDLSGNEIVAAWLLERSGGPDVLTDLSASFRAIL